MQKITTVAGLKNAIEHLEYKQANEWPLLKDQFLTTCESLKLINIIKSTFKEAVSASDLKTNAVNAVIGLTTGFAAKILLIGKTHNLLTKLLGIIIEMVVANKVVKNVDGIKSIGGTILKKIVNQRDSSEKA